MRAPNENRERLRELLKKARAGAPPRPHDVRTREHYERCVECREWSRTVDASFAKVEREEGMVVLIHLRRRKRTEVPLEDLNHPGSDNEAPREFGSSDTSMLGAIDRLNLMRAIRKLPSGYKRFFLLYDVIGYEHKEIAGRLRCSTGCSKSRLHKARKRLRQLLRGEQRAPVDVAAA